MTVHLIVTFQSQGDKFATKVDVVGLGTEKPEELKRAIAISKIVSDNIQKLYGGVSVLKEENTNSIQSVMANTHAHKPKVH
ncbi:hypothetical protein ACOGYP_000384 [Edwardsiella piscicida]|nr:hypothetical protein [Edwardsiella piscicida]